MNKKLIIGLSIFFILISIITNNANAYLLFEPFEAIYMTDSYGTTPKTIFDWNEIPWLYIRLPEDGFNVTLAFWESHDLTVNNSYAGYAQEIWLTLGEDKWYDIRTLGEWEIQARYTQSPYVGSGSTSFTVTPEPLSSVLFVTGGATLAALRCWRRKRKISKQGRL